MENFITRVTKPKQTPRKKSRKTTVSKGNAEETKEIIDNGNENQIDKFLKDNRVAGDFVSIFSAEGNLL